MVAAEVAVRVLVMAGAVALYYLTTRPAELVASLQAHGAPARLTFVVLNAVAMIPRLLERAGEVAEAQRARGLDSEGSLRRRLRGLTAVSGPTVLGAIDEAEVRAMALEMRGFSRPGHHTLLWAPRDDPGQRLARWVLLVAVAVLVGLRWGAGRGTAERVMTAPVLSLRDVVYRYPGASRDSLQVDDLDLEPGSLTVVLGAAGSGLSTLCLVLGGLAPRVVGGDLRGTLLLGGEDVHDWPTHSRPKGKTHE